MFEQLNRRLFSNDFLARHRQEAKDFTRERCLTFVVGVIFLLNMLKRSQQDELDKFFKLLSGADVAVRVVTKSAFTQARKKLKYQAFVELNQAQTAYYYEFLAPKRWLGWRLVAVGGSMVQVPNTMENLAHFGAWQPVKEEACAMARVSQMFDVLNHVTLDALIVPKAQGERELAAALLAYLCPDDLVLLDRGYPAFWLFALILGKNAQFCARMKLSGWAAVERFVASGLSEQIVSLQPAYAARKECHDRNLPVKPLAIRLVRVELEDGNVQG